MVASLVPRLYLFLFLSIWEAVKKETMDVKEKVKPGMQVCEIHIHFL